MKRLIVAIDGPSGAGKSTLSKLLAQKLDYINIDTGAMYRSVALAVRQNGIDLSDDKAVDDLLQNINIRFRPGAGGDRILLNDIDVSEEIRNPEISTLTPEVAAIPAVRRAMVSRQRQLGEQGGVVLEGRDIGTVVFPQAQVKLFLVASAGERGRRRFEELRAKGHDVDLARTISEVEARDFADSQRQHSPLVQAEDAIVIDTDGLTIGQVLDRMLAVVSARQKE
ncbi:MAG: (d)CMP kinase [Desulfuromonas sp.]|nr:MAG: (d)CMP kinase [Desulfuromonas sp.]